MYWVFEGSLPWEKEISPLPNQIQRLQAPIKLYVETIGGSMGARIPRAYPLSIKVLTVTLRACITPPSVCQAHDRITPFQLVSRRTGEGRYRAELGGEISGNLSMSRLARVLSHGLWKNILKIVFVLLIFIRGHNNHSIIQDTPGIQLQSGNFVSLT